MEPSYWLAAWDEERTAFHSDAVHPALPKHEESFLGGGAHHVLVPLCGKSVDLAWMAARGHQVVGVELAEKAIVAFHAREHRGPTVTEAEGFRAYRSPGLMVLQGDVFALTPEIAGPIDRVWDRAALVALTPEQRVKYVEVLRTLLLPGAVVLLETFDYDQAQKPGPPHAVTEDEVRTLWAGAKVERLDQHDATEEVRPRGWNLDRFVVSLWRIEL